MFNQLDFMIFKNVCLTSPDAVIALDYDGKIIFWNDSATKLFGYTKDEVIGRDLHQLLAPEYLWQRYKEAFKTFQKNGIGTALNKIIELIAVNKDKQIIPIELTISAFYIDGKWYLAGIVRDISARKIKEDELNEAKAQLEQALMLKNEFISNISHELRTPLNGILGLTDLLYDTPLTDEQMLYLDGIKQSAATLNKLIESILYFSNLQSNVFSNEAVEFNLHDCVMKVCNEYKPAATAKGLQFNIDITSEVPTVLIGDVKKLSLALDKLLDNAIKFTHNGAINVGVILQKTEGDYAYIHFIVKDTGIGIPDQKQELIFQPFVQANGSKHRRYQGVGIGLTLAKALIKKMDGSIWVQSEPDKGTEFHFLLSFKMPTITPQIAPLANNEVINNQTVLLVDDVEINQIIVKRFFEKKGFNVVTACNGTEALKLYKKGGIDIVLMDISMPEMDGINASKLIREYEVQTGKSALIMLMSAHNESDFDSEFINKYIDGYIKKPINLQALMQVINNAKSQQVKTN